MMELRRQAGELLNTVLYSKKSYLVQRSGEDMAVIVPVPEYAEYLRQKDDARQRLAQKIEHVRQQIESSGVSENELRSVIDKVIEEVRTEALQK